MEEIKCFLLGFSSYALDVSAAAEASSDAHAQKLVSSRAADETANAWLPAHLRAVLDPAELHLLGALRPLGPLYAALARAAEDAAVGRTTGLYASAIGAAVERLTGLYAADVRRATTPSALLSLRATYELTFAQLHGLVVAARACGSRAAAGAEDADVAALLSALQRCTSHNEIPFAFRQTVGMCVWRAVLYTTAHYVAHGVVLHGRWDYFISAQPSATAGGASTERHTLHTDRLPAGISVDLGMLILTAGKERRVLLSEGEPSPGAAAPTDHLTSLAVGAQDAAADAVFEAVCSDALCAGGVLQSDALTARVEAARALWSKALWTRVGSTTALSEQLTALQAIFLCARGDVWQAFVERCFEALGGVDPHATMVSLKGRMTAVAADGSSLEPSFQRQQHTPVPAKPSAAGGFSWAAAQCAVTGAFTYALSATGLSEQPAYDGYRVLLAAPQSAEEEEELYGSSSSRSVEAAAQLLLDRARGIGVRFVPRPGVQLVVSPKALSYYQRLFSLHLGLRFAMHAMHLTRQLFAGAIVTNHQPSADLRRAYVLFQRLYFLLATIAYYFQVDVISAPARDLREHLLRCRTVEDAKRRHDLFLWRVAEGTFLTEGSEALHAACRSLCDGAVTLYVLCTRYRLNYWAVDGQNRTPVEVAASLAALETRVQQRVVAAFTGNLPVSSRPAERALWARVDFNGFFSRRSAPSAGAAAAAAPNTFAMPTQLPTGMGRPAAVTARQPPLSSPASATSSEPPKERANAGAAGAQTRSRSTSQQASQRRKRSSSRPGAPTASVRHRTRHADASPDVPTETSESGVAEHRTVIASPATKYRRSRED